MIFKASSSCSATGANCVINITASTATFTFSAGLANTSSISLTLVSVRNPQSEYVSSSWSILSYYVENTTTKWSINEDTSITVLPNEYGDMITPTFVRVNSSNI